MPRPAARGAQRGSAEGTQTAVPSAARRSFSRATNVFNAFCPSMRPCSQAGAGRSFIARFAARIVKLHRYLTKEKHEGIISKQLIRSATSIGANANEAVYGSSTQDFLAKLHISLKETAETEYWLRLLQLSEYLTEKEAASLLNDCLEIKRILIASINTTKANLK